jgi:hypothetical protein
MAYEDRIMRMADSVPQRAVRPTMRDVAGPVRETQGGREQDVFDPRRIGGPYTSGVQDVFDQRRLGLGGGPLTFGEQDVFDQRRLGLDEGPYTYGKDPFDPRRLGMDSGIFGGSKAGPASDTVGSILGGMGRGQEEGFESVEKTTDDRMEEKLWGKAVNNFPPGTPDMVLQQEWERLKQDYFNRKYGGGPTFPSRDDIVGLS